MPDLLERSDDNMPVNTLITKYFFYLLLSCSVPGHLLVMFVNLSGLPFPFT